MHKTILVTGATGTVGKEVAIQLSMMDEDIRVRAGVHSIIKGENLKRLPNVEVVEMDFKDQESLHAAFTHVDKVFMVTPFTNDQVQMAKTLVDEAKRQGVKHLVKLSVIHADTAPGFMLGRWHREIEKYIEDSGIPYTFLRPSSFMQNYIHYDAESIKNEGRFYHSTGNGKIGLIDVRDIAAVGVEVLLGSGHEGKAYELTGPEAISNQQAAQIIGEVTGTQVQYVDVPADAARSAMLEKKAPEWMVDAMLELESAYSEGRFSDTTDTVQQLTGRPPHSFRQFVKDHQESFE
ncbi:SDR family NAD(P)-dependent oxidoreductase [Pontibacter diazotrophicus]|uniref:SDR family NAD(P)-dependent oxidoreductase n=1 Tax=Pontibacter diazotrophicus TaxID=1400979 RepID=A0A3D8LCI9_9BACT|nr:SDR family oxidoreductase [Pontibacter diazotrophicus]RDV15110.1 SDR family NAD(P)-dependent oxidoreductase [Pontibacter diazotrophicus]